MTSTWIQNPPPIAPDTPVPDPQSKTEKLLGDILRQLIGLRADLAYKAPAAPVSPYPYPGWVPPSYPYVWSSQTPPGPPGTTVSYNGDPRESQFER